MKFITKLITQNDGPQPYYNKKINKMFKNLTDEQKTFNFGKKNKNKIFYIMRRSPGAGIFSNLIVILNHLKICKKKKYTPHVDMTNFVTVYNEKKKINKKNNAWEYYFKNFSKYSLKEIYKSKNVIISANKIKRNMINWPHFNKEFKKIFKKNIFFNTDVKKILKYFLKKYKIDKYKTIGVHFRGTSYKRSPRHPMPATIEQIKLNIDNLIEKYNYKKIFLVTEEKKYLVKLKKTYGTRLIHIDTYRSNKDDAFVKYPRNNHRYKLGLESVIECYLLSKCSAILYVSSNLVSVANLMANKKQKLFELFNGWNSKNKLFANFNWFIRKNLHSSFFGLKNKLIKH